jgi:hypothetical protein
MIIRYKITLKGDGCKRQYHVMENGDITTVRWSNSMGKPYSLAYQTSMVTQYLKEGRWKRVPSKRDIQKHSFLSPNLFSLDDI